LLLIAGSDGSLSLWDVTTGENVWQKTPRQTEVKYTNDASFARDGESFVICNNLDFAFIGKTATGEKVGVVSFPPTQTNIMSACLTPDGSRGVLITTGEEVFTFEVKTGAMQDTGVTGAWPVRGSEDGKYAAFRSGNKGKRESLRVLRLDDKPASRDTTQLGYIGHIKPVEGGDFLVTDARRDGEKNFMVGSRCTPSTGELKEVWKVAAGEDWRRMDFDLITMRGVYTSWSLKTRLIDLRTGEELLKIDNSANARPEMVSTSFGPGVGDKPPKDAKGDSPALPVAYLLAIGVGAVFILILVVLAGMRSPADQ